MRSQYSINMFRASLVVLPCVRSELNSRAWAATRWGWRGTITGLGWAGFWTRICGTRGRFLLFFFSFSFAFFLGIVEWRYAWSRGVYCLFFFFFIFFILGMAFRPFGFGYVRMLLIRYLVVWVGFWNFGWWNNGHTRRAGNNNTRWQA